MEVQVLQHEVVPLPQQPVQNPDLAVTGNARPRSNLMLDAAQPAFAVGRDPHELARREPDNKVKRAKSLP